MFTGELFILAGIGTQPKCPSTEECIKKMWYIFTMKYYAAIKKWNNVICSIMDGLRDCHTDWNKSEKDK